MSKKLRELQAKKAQAAQAKSESLKAASGLLDKAAAESRDLTAEEQAEFGKHKAAADAKAGDIDRIQAQIDVEQELIAAQAQAQGVVHIAGNGTDIRVEENVEQDPKRGFKNAGDYFKAVHSAAFSRQNGASVDQRLLIGASAPTTFGNEAAGGDGGFSIPPEFATDIFTLSLGEGALLPLTDDVDVDGNAMAFPKDETTPWGTNGVRAYWQGEVSAGTQTKPVLQLNNLRLKKLMALVPVSDELLADTSALNSYLPEKIGASIQWKTNEAILYGQGGAVPYGALQSAAAITVSKDNGQSTGTLTATNLANMIARLPAGSFGKAVWIMNNDVLPALFTLTLGNYPIYLPNGVMPGGIQMSPYGTLLGRPIIVSQHAKSFSSTGDVNLVDLSYYQVIKKAAGVEMATSMHLYFDADATAFRAVFRMDGMSKLSAAITPANGSNKLSPFLQLQNR
jgi:HK97 family phage major capsid protein